MVLERGTKIGGYEIVERVTDLGAGEAYKASDTAHGRSVTLRLLGASTGDAAQAAHIASDTQSLAALAHSGIAAVYEVLTHDDSLYRVTEYLEGETLAQRLVRGPLDLGEALRIGIAVADAVDYAHRHGIVHRTLSPNSIVLTGDGVKVVDFGLDAAPAGGGDTPATSMASTRSVVPSAMAAATGAMPYQAPEQLQGKDGDAADARSDVFALGTILYAMLTGKPAFEGKTQALLIAAITTVDPEPVSESQSLAPPALDYLVGRCLVKDPKKRLQTARDLAAQLRWISGEGNAEGGLAASLEIGRKRARQVRIGLVAAVALVLVLAPFVYWSGSGGPGVVEARFIVNDMGFQTTNGVGAAPQLSPNGQWMTSSRGLTDGLDALALDSVTKQILLNGHAVFLQFWNPNDDNEVAFWEGGLLKRAPVAGGEPTNIVEVPQPFGGGTWNREGVIVYSSQGVLYRVLDTGGDPVPVLASVQGDQSTQRVAPMFLPDDRHFLFLAASPGTSDSAIYAASLDDDEPIRLIEAESRPLYAEPGYILFNRADVIYAQAFDPDGLTIEGEPLRVADGVMLGGSGLGGEIFDFSQSANFSVSQTGVLAYRIGTPGPDGTSAPGGSAEIKSLVWFDRNAGSSPVGEDGSFAGVALAPDDRRFAVHRHEGGGGDIWLYDPDQGGMRRWTVDISQENSSPVWSPEGDQIAFASRRDGGWGIYVKAVDGTGPETQRVEGDAPLAPMSWAPNGEIVYWVLNPATGHDIWAVPSTGDGTARPVIATDAQERYPQVSPDGNWIAFEKPDDAGNVQVWVNSFPEPQGPGWQITNNGGTWPRWRDDGGGLELFFAAPPNGLFSVELRVVGAAIQPGGQPGILFGVNNPNLRASTHYNVGASYHRYDVTADGQRFLMPQPQATAPEAGGGGGGTEPIAELVRTVVDGGTQGPGGSNEIAVILDWTRLLPED